VDHLVVGEDEHEVLVKGIEKREGDVVVVMFAVDGVLGEVPKGVVHPPMFHLSRSPGPEVDRALTAARRRLLGDGGRAGALLVDDPVEIPQEVDRFEVLSAAEAVGDPLARPPAVIQVQHARHRVHAKRVCVVPVQPVHGVGDEEALHLFAPIVEDEGAPVLLEAQPGILVLIEGRAVEARQPVSSLGSGRAPNPG